MLVRTSLLVSLSLFWAAGALPADTDTQEVSFDKPVEIPEAVLQPGKYKFQLEDRLADRAIVRITEPNGTNHYVLSVPSKKLNADNKGVTFFSEKENAEAIHGWECSDCKRPLEFVYPKDEAVKLTGETGQPVLAYDPSYDKLPANLSPDDRKIVTLWLLSPKTVTPDGKGEGLTAAKYSAPNPLMASANPLPRKMPKTSANMFSEIFFGLLSLLFGLFLYWRRKSAERT